MSVRVLPALLALTACPSAPVDSDPDVDTAQAVTLRVATWNVQSVGRTSSDEFTAAVQVLKRIDADVVGINEVDSDEMTALPALAEAAGYPFVFLPDDNPFGGLRNAILSKHAFVAQKAWTSAVLSGDNRANDVTRLPLSVDIQLPNNPATVRIVSEHWKSGFDLADRFRRASDGFRTAGAARTDAPEYVFALGDVNAEYDRVPESPALWSYPPTEGYMPGDWRAGPDLQAELDGEGLHNNAFHYLVADGVEPLPALQIDGRDGTRPASGKRIDYIFANAALRALAPVAEVYDCTDEGQGGLPKTGDAPPREACADASDHLPVFADVVLPAN